MGLRKSDHNEQLITITIITLSGFHCTHLIIYFAQQETNKSTSSENMLFDIQNYS